MCVVVICVTYDGDSIVGVDMRALGLLGRLQLMVILTRGVVFSLLVVCMCVDVGVDVDMCGGVYIDVNVGGVDDGDVGMVTRCYVGVVVGVVGVLGVGVAAYAGVVVDDCIRVGDGGDRWCCWLR